jgi:hypothetical protein
MFIHLSHNQFSGCFFLRKEVGFPPHEREETAVKIINALALLNS